MTTTQTIEIGDAIVNKAKTDIVAGASAEYDTLKESETKIKANANNIATNTTNIATNTSDIETLNEFMFEEEIYLRIGVIRQGSSTPDLNSFDARLINSTVGTTDKIIIEATSGDPEINWSNYGGTLIYNGSEDGVGFKSSGVYDLTFQLESSTSEYSKAYSVERPSFGWNAGTYMAYVTVKGGTDSGTNYHRPKCVFKPIKRA